MIKNFTFARNPVRWVDIEKNITIKNEGGYTKLVWEYWFKDLVFVVPEGKKFLISNVILGYLDKNDRNARWLWYRFSRYVNMPWNNNTEFKPYSFLEWNNKRYELVIDENKKDNLKNALLEAGTYKIKAIKETREFFSSSSSNARRDAENRKIEVEQAFNNFWVSGWVELQFIVEILGEELADNE